MTKYFECNKIMLLFDTSFHSCDLYGAGMKIDFNVKNSLFYFVTDVIRNFFFQDDPGIDLNNPRWVGAWWMGFLVLGGLLLFFTILLVLFPRRLPKRFRSEKETKENDDKTPPKLKGKRKTKTKCVFCKVTSVKIRPVI